MYKKCDKYSVSNYRPVSLLPVISEVLQKAMHSGLNHHLNTRSILAPERHAFKSGVSTEDAAFDLTDNVLRSLNPLAPNDVYISRTAQLTSRR